MLQYTLCFIKEGMDRKACIQNQDLALAVPISLTISLYSSSKSPRREYSSPLTAMQLSIHDAIFGG